MPWFDKYYNDDFGIGKIVTLITIIMLIKNKKKL